ncbi:MAG: hypothetical protein IKF82_01415 [Bacilli bacterium]|nr:hypothetical protein [Bacilli bacterium]
MEKFILEDFFNNKHIIELNPLNDYELTAINYALQKRGLNLDWYVLRYDVETTEYNNEIVFKDIIEAYEEFLNTEPNYPNERIELVFAPSDEDEEFGENMVINYKVYGKRGEQYEI